MENTQSNIHSAPDMVGKAHTELKAACRNSNQNSNTVISEAERGIPVHFPLELDSDETFKIVLQFAHVALLPFCLLCLLLEFLHEARAALIPT